MRRMRCNETGTVICVTKHIVLKNFWEYYVTDDRHDNTNIYRCFVMGFENELGDVDLDEIKPFIINETNNLQTLLPAIGWQWLEEGNEKQVEA